MKTALGLLSLTLSILCSGSTAWAQTPQKNVERVLTCQSPTLNLKTVATLSNDVRTEFVAASTRNATIEFEKAIDGSTTIRDYEKGFKSIFSTQEKQADQENLIFDGLAGTMKVKAQVIGAIISKSHPLVGTLYASGTAKLFDYLGAELRKAQGQNLKLSLEKLKKEQQSTYRQLMKNGTPAQVSQALTDVGYFLDTDLARNSPDKAKIALELKTAFLNQAITQGLARVISDVDVTRTSVEEVKKNLFALSNSFTDFQKTTLVQLETLANQQQDINNGLNDFYKQYGQDRQSILFMESFMFSKMSPDEQLSALKSKQLRSIPPEEQVKLKAEIEIVVKRQNMLKTAGTILNRTQTTLQILGDLGIGRNSKLLADLTQGVAIGQKSFEAGQNLLSGNYLEAVASITSLFGRKRDIAGERHKQIMDALGDIRKDIAGLDKKLDVLMQGQQELMKNQAQLYEAVVSVAQQIADNHGAVMRELNAVSKDVNFVGIQLKDLAASDCQDCQYLSNLLKLEYESGQLPPYKDVAAMVLNFRTTKMRNCFNFLNRYTIGADGKSVNSYYYMATYDKTPSNRAIIDHNERMFQIASSLYFGDTTIPTDQKLVSLYYPAGSYSEIDQKLSRGKLISESKYLLRDPNVMQNIVSPQACKELAQAARNLHYLFSLTDNDDQIIDVKSINKDTKFRTTGYTVLEEALKMVNLCIAQQTLLGGDIFLETVNRQLDKEDIAPSFLALLTELLNGSSELSNNFISYSIKRRISFQGSASQYYFAYQLGDSSIMKKFLKLPYKPIYYSAATTNAGKTISQGWYLRVDNTLHKLPTPDDVVEGTLSVEPQIYALLALRQDLLNEMAGYEAYMNVDIAARQAINYSLLRQAVR